MRSKCKDCKGISFYEHGPEKHKYEEYGGFSTKLPEIRASAEAEGKGPDGRGSGTAERKEEGLGRASQAEAEALQEESIFSIPDGLNTAGEVIQPVAESNPPSSYPLPQEATGGSNR
uniref:Uncharacterized protein n=1 Tax=Chromera velia CCMP2878 TaxID=1169474 RepID=A0A0G4I0H4_9ALVE|eukprot:Cvel_9913.t1-p1 / transcript=Cvel_9913.t1 / gene=Cvel_9913 / organism=Chromera_velia_CCMP2878 / gene_product=hypothetical protein / transcript_product=hypothetical protein / location=Cvel_scaffold585:49394-49741(-) / protein_length=116 / sequence_SO=supercontig / SO=protein_coding / is_pseudo=false